MTAGLNQILEYGDYLGFQGRSIITFRNPSRTDYKLEESIGKDPSLPLDRIGVVSLCDADCKVYRLEVAPDMAALKKYCDDDFIRRGQQAKDGEHLAAKKAPFLPSLH